MNDIRPFDHRIQATKQAGRYVSANPTPAIVNVVTCREAGGKAFDADSRRAVAICSEHTQLNSRNLHQHIA
jgi:hypothetical protein